MAQDRMHRMPDGIRKSKEDRKHTLSSCQEELDKGYKGNSTQNTGSVKTPKSQLRSVERTGFFDCSSSDRLTDEQKEDLIAENIYDWWISGKSYKEWYADKFLQTKLEFPEEE